MAVRVRRFAAGLAALAAILLLPYPRPAPAQTPPPAKPEMTENCPGLVASDAPRLIPAAWQLAALNPDQVRITFAGHSTFLIESPQLVRIATDYNDYVRPPVVPDIITMNHAHDTHYTDRPDPAIKYVLRGWGPSPDQPARYDLQVKDVRVRNVPTNIRNWGGGTERNGNSIFIFEIANMCIAHLGHLHHRLTKDHLDELGRIDVLMVPIDGSYTMGQPLMVDVIKQIQPKLVLPMHYWGRSQVERFQGLMQPLDADFVWPEHPTIDVVREELPQNLTVIVLGGNGGD